MVPHKITIGFLSATPPQDKFSSSGTFHSMAVALEKAGFAITWIPAKEASLAYKLYRKCIKEIVRIIPNLKKHLSLLPNWRARIIARSVDQKLLKSCDVLFAPMQSVALSALNTAIPIVYLSDATYRIMVNYYWTNIPKRDIHALDIIEKKAMDKSNALIYPCRWAAQSAINDYKQNPSRITMAYFGPNFTEEDIRHHIFSPKDVFHILFVGVDWDRKGGGIAVEAGRWLNENGVPTILHITGIRKLAHNICDLPFIRDEGFLNKNTPEDYSKLVSLYEASDCFLLPTKAECTGISFSEASAFGLPCFSHRTGGVEDYIIDGETGRLLPLGSTGEDFGRAIKEAIVSGKMVEMSKAARSYYNGTLNWAEWTKSIKAVIESSIHA